MMTHLRHSIGALALLAASALPGCGARTDLSACADAACSSTDSDGCESGFRDEGSGCVDVDECAAAPGPCPPDRPCVNEPGSFTCACLPGKIPPGATLWFSPEARLGGRRFDGSSLAVGFLDRVYFAVQDSPESGFFMSYRPSEGTFSQEPLHPDNPFCACGYNGRPVPLGNALYVFANEGLRFDGASWKALRYTQQDQRGEAAAAAFGGRVLLLGGRRWVGFDSNALTDGIVAYDPASASWEDVQARIPFGPMKDAAAAAIEDRLYLVAPTEPAQLRAFDGETWTALPSAPFGALVPVTVAFDGKLALLDKLTGAFALFDPRAGAWSDLVPLPAGDSWDLAVAECDLWLVGEDSEGVRIHRLAVAP
jgi:hypothetical protein